MNLEYKHLLPSDFDKDSRVWIYQSSRLLALREAMQTEELLEHFVSNWKSHGAPVKGFATLFFGQFLTLMADEKATGVSGCSTDSSVRLVKELEKLFHISLFDRQSLAFVVKDKVELLPLNQVQYAIDRGFLTPGTLYFDNLVCTKEEMEQQWIKPIKDSWLQKKVQFPASNPA